MRISIISKTLKIKDFEQLKKGASISDVEKIDPLTPVYVPTNVGEVISEQYDFELEEYVSYTYTSDPVLSYQTFHYTADGIVCITYERESGNDAFTVAKVGYNETFEVPDRLNKGTDSIKIDAEELP